MTHTRKLRQKAELCRRVAGIATQGGTTADRILLRLARRLEEEADATEREQSPALTAKT
jgi:hypothetical protein